MTVRSLRGVCRALVLLLAFPLAAHAGSLSPRKLNLPLPPGGRVAFGFAVSPDGRRVVYLADQETAGLQELWSVAPSGGPPVKLNGPLPAGGVSSFAVSPDSRWVVYVAPLAGGGTGVFRVPIAGGDSVALGGPPSQALRSFSITSDSAYIVYEVVNGPREIYSEPLTAGGGVIKLAGPTPIGGSNFGIHLSPDGRYAVYNGGTNLFSVPVAGGPVAHLNPGIGGFLFRFAIAPDSSRVVFIGGFSEVFSVPIAGGVPVRLGQGFLPLLTFSPDSAWVVFFAEHFFSAPLAGGGPFTLAQQLQGGEVVITPDSSQVIFTANSNLFAVPIAGGPRVQLNVGPGSDTARRPAVTPDASFVLYVERDLLRVPLAGGPAVRLSHTLPAFASVRQFQLTNDGSSVVYLAADAVPNVPELFNVPVAGGAPAKLNGPLTTGGRILTFTLTPDGRHVVYLADQETRGIPELYAADLVPGCSVDIRVPRSQRDPRWSCDHYDHCPASPRCTDADTDECNIGDLGCALTALSMALEFAGIDTDPGRLNEFLKQLPATFAAHGVVFPNATREIVQVQTDPLLRQLKLKVPQGGRKNSLQDPAGAEKDLDDALCGAEPHPMIVKVPNSKGVLGHYLLVTGRRESPGGSPSYLVIDPYPRAVPKTTLAEYLNTQGVPEFETVGSVVDPPGDISELNVAVEDAVSLLVTDDRGRRTGVDPADGQRVQEIPDSSHGLDGVEDEESGDQPFASAHTVSIFQPAEGRYRFQLTGVRPSTYTLVVHPWFQDGTAQPVLTLPGIATAGSEAAFEVELQTAPGTVSRLSRQATFDSALGDVAGAAAQGLISSPGIANALAAKLEAAAAAAHRGQTTASRNQLAAFKAQLAAQTPQHVTPLAAQVLREDADSLLAELDE